MLDSIGDKGVPSQGTESKKSQDHSLKGCPTQERCHQGHGERQKGSRKRREEMGEGGWPRLGGGGSTDSHSGFAVTSSKGGNFS